MTSTEPGRCDSCGRQRWVGERFCAGCGIENTDVENEASSPLIDLDHDVAQSSNPTPKSSRRESLIGLGAIVAVLALVALFFVAGNDAAEELAEARPDNPFPSGTPTAEPEATATPPPTRRPSPASTTSADTDGDLETPTPQAFSQQLADFVADLDLGEGWIVSNASSRFIAVELTSGATIAAEPEYATNAGISYVLPVGVISANFNGRWSFASWTGNDSPFAAALEDQGSADPGSQLLFVDPSVGPVLVHLDLNFGSEITATALETGETQVVPIADPLNSIIAHFAFGNFGFQTAGIGFLSDDGRNVYSWTWDDGWTKIAEGQLTSIDSRLAVVSQCQGPNDCPATIIDVQGESLAQAISGLLGSGFGGMTRLNPLDDSYARLGFSGGQSSGPPIEIVGLDGGVRFSIPLSGDDGRWQSIDAWSPNGRYLFATASRDLAAIDATTGEILWLDATGGPFRQSGDNQGSIVFIDQISR